MNVMFGSWKVLRKKNIKDNDFLLFDFIMKNIKEAYKKNNLFVLNLFFILRYFLFSFHFSFLFSFLYIFP